MEIGQFKQAVERNFGRDHQLPIMHATSIGFVAFRGAGMGGGELILASDAPRDTNVTKRIIPASQVHFAVEGLKIELIPNGMSVIHMNRKGEIGYDRIKVHFHQHPYNDTCQNVQWGDNSHRRQHGDSWAQTWEGRQLPPSTGQLPRGSTK